MYIYIYMRTTRCVDDVCQSLLILSVALASIVYTLLDYSHHTVSC